MQWSRVTRQPCLEVSRMSAIQAEYVRQCILWFQHSFNDTSVLKWFPMTDAVVRDSVVKQPRYVAEYKNRSKCF